MKISSKNVWLDGKFTPATVETEAGIITSVTKIDTKETDCEDYVLPGFISTHDHGALGKNANEADHKFLDDWSHFLLKEGVTSFLPTTSTLSKEGLFHALSVLGAYQGNPVGAHYLGINAEGPMFSTDMRAKGAHEIANIFPPSLELIETMLAKAQNKIRLITIAPELEGAMDVYDYCAKHNVKVFMGHMDAKAADVKLALQHGAVGLTHLFNGMPSLHHRDLGPVGIGLLEDSLYVEIIADGVHISDDTIRLVYKVKPHDKIITITDSIFGKGLPAGTYSRGDKGGGVTINEAGQVHLESGRLAGSTNRLNRLVAHQIDDLGMDQKAVIDSVTINPAALLEVNKGVLGQGYDADIIVTDSHFNVKKVYLNGQEAELEL